MSTKTLRKRIALVAVSALTAGVLSVASTPVANATALANTIFGATAANNPTACTVVTTAGSEQIVLPLGVDLVVSGSGNMESNDAFKFAMPGATVQGWAATNQTSRAETLSADRTTVTFVSTGTPAAPTSITYRASAVGTYVLTVSERDVSTSAAFADIEAISVSWVTACANNVYNAAKSTIQAKDDNGNAASAVDEATGLVRPNSETAYIALDLKDAYGNALSGAGSLIATATNGAVISWDAAPSVQSSTAYLGTRGAIGTELFVVQGLANEDKPVTTTVTISLDGSTIATKTIRFNGAASKIVISDVTIGTVAGTNGYFAASVQDSAGNNLYTGATTSFTGLTVANDSIANAANGSGVIANINASSVSVGGSTLSLAGTKSTATAGTIGQIACVKSGSTTLNVQHVTNAVTGAAIKASFTAACSTGLDTWSVSLDKATYSPGEIATLTISGKDSSGNPINTNDTLGTLEQSFGGMTFVSAPTSADKFDSAAGAKRYTLAVGASEGSFVGTFKIAGATDKTAKTIQYKVANSTATVTNADVLKSIVALIASINKQIQALQKLILRR
jgi:hypothetical protein